MRRSQSIAVITIAFIAWVILTWLVIRTPGQSPFPSPVLDDSKLVSDSASLPVESPGQTSAPAAAAIKDPKAPIVPKAPFVPIIITAPALNDNWELDVPHTIQWSRVPGVIGGVSLVNANDGTTVGWIVQQIDREQTSSPWDTRFVQESRTSALKKEVAPGRYFIKIIFDAPAHPTVSSKSFFIAPSG